MGRIVDLTLTYRDGMRGVAMEPATTISDQGWNTRNLHLYSHAGTHMDAPLHFVDGGSTIDDVSLSKCVGPAWVIDIPDVGPRALLDVGSLGHYAEDRKSTRLNSSHKPNSYAVFCLKKKNPRATQAGQERLQN